MARFLSAAYAVLTRERRPLAAREIVDLAAAQGLLQSRGCTPWQTMKSKLSTDILARGTESLFMRAEKGKFALREWKGELQEHVADRYQKALFDEDIVVFPSGSLRKYVPVVGIYRGEFDRDGLLLECRPMRRRQAEEDETVIQLVSFFVVHHDERYLTYKRTKRLPEARLHGSYSIGFGGHLNPDDVSRLLNIFDPGLGTPLLLRELNEELRLKTGEIWDLCYRGLLYDNSRPVSRQHLGVTYDVILRTGEFEIGERGFLMDAKYETLKEIIGRQHQFENWSLLIIEEERQQKGL